MSDGSYLGFTCLQMLEGLKRSCDVVRLDSGSEDGVWRLRCSSREFGSLDISGSLLYVLGQASKPFISRWRIERSDFQLKMSRFLGAVGESRRGGCDAG